MNRMSVDGADADKACPLDPPVVAASRPLGGVSIVVPIAPHDSAWAALLPNLRGISPDAEVVLAAAESEPADLRSVVSEARLQCPVRWTMAPCGRGRQLNAGAAISTGRHLWFLHGDSRVTAAALAALDASIGKYPDALLYFSLKFDDDGMPALRLNEWGAWIRSRYLKMPFGDQGFCLSRETFDRIGSYAETAAYGEDHLLAWAARREGVPLRWAGTTLVTSGRKYVRDGWLTTTALHGWRTWRQALPEAWKAVWSRCR